MKLKAATNKQRQINLNWDMINAYLSKWKPGTPIDIEIVRRVKRHSDPLRKYYFGIVLPIFLEAHGYEPDESLIVHRHLKILFSGVEPDNHGIYREKDIPSIFSNESTVPVPQKQKFVEWIKRKSAEQGFYTPDPGE